MSTLGRTFLDMLQQSDLCGSIRHVIELYEEHARTYLGVILPGITQHGSKIDQARAGCILEEHCAITDPAIDTWATGAMRGGSTHRPSTCRSTPSVSASRSMPSLLPDFREFRTAHARGSRDQISSGSRSVKVGASSAVAYLWSGRAR